jgi:hypothetical protein
MWGHPPDQLGRIPKAVSVALQEDADVMVFGTGASVKDNKKEGEYTRDFMLEHFLALEQFSRFQEVDLAPVKPRFREISHAECCSQNTREEMEEAGKVFFDLGMEKVILVSSPTHISRCIRDALEVFRDEKYYTLRENLFATACDTSYLGGRVGDVVIFEPPHRGDQQAFLTHYVVKRIFKISEEEMPHFLKDLDVLLMKYEA